jgi:RNA polymerase sigma-70 factor (ECF subfamily)
MPTTVSRSGSDCVLNSKKAYYAANVTKFNAFILPRTIDGLPSSNKKMDLVAEIVADKAAGTRRLVSEYGNRLYETAIRLCGNEADAQDYAFRTLERAVDRIRLFSGRSSFFTWLYEILVNLIRTDARRKAANALVFPEELPPCEDPRPNVGEQLSAQDEAAIVRAAVRELPPHLRAATVFRYYEDLTIPEIARILSVREGTVKSRLHEAKCRIRERIARTIRPDAPSNGKEIEQ